jgi:bacterioferritin-associated ferredoxin
MIVCVCHRVSDRDIARAARQGCASFDELQDHLRVGTACGACGDCARHTFDHHQQQQPLRAGAIAWLGCGAVHSAPLALTTPAAGLL